jgi:N-acetylneuraminate synthase
MNNVYVIAEAGVNHNGSLKLAKKLVDEAYKCGADAVKFQTFITEDCLSLNIEKANYQENNTGSGTQFEMVKKLELSFDDHLEIYNYCKSVGIDYMTTAFDIKSLNFVNERFDVKSLKIGSGEITNLPLILAHSKSGKNIILSTGMCSLGDIELALGVLAFGFINDPEKEVNLKNFYEAFVSEEGQSKLTKYVTLLHCTTEYPAPFNEVNLNVLNTFKRAFNCKIGYSDHTQGIVVPILSVAYGVSVIEKHFTLDNDMEGPDHKASLEPSEMLAMVNGIRQASLSLGRTIKLPTKSEVNNLSIVRKVILAKSTIQQGEIFTEENLCIKRSKGTLNPSQYWEILGTIANKHYEAEEAIE